MQEILIDWQSELVDCIHFLHNKGWAPATSSNYSYRERGDRDFYISTSGVDKGEFSQQHFMKVDLKGQPINDSRKPSAETLLHAMIYQRLSEVGCILHTHTVYNTVLSTWAKNKKYVQLEGFEVLKGLTGIKTHDVSVEIPVFENAQDMPALVNEIEQFWDQQPQVYGFLLAGHGLYTWGKTIAEAKRHIEVLEFLFEVVYKLKAVV